MFSDTGVPGCEVNSWDSCISAAVKLSKVCSTSEDGSDFSCDLITSGVDFNLLLDGVSLPSTEREVCYLNELSSSIILLSINHCHTTM